MYWIEHVITKKLINIGSTTIITTHDSTINGLSQDQTKCYVNMSRILTIINHVYENLVEKLER